MYRGHAVAIDATSRQIYTRLDLETSATIHADLLSGKLIQLPRLELIDVITCAKVQQLHRNIIVVDLMTKGVWLIQQVTKTQC